MIRLFQSVLIKNNWLIWIVIIITLLICLNDQQRKLADYKDHLKIKEGQILKWKDKAGRNRSRDEILTLEAKNARKILDAQLRDSIKKEVGNLKRNLINYQSVKSSTSAIISSKLKGADLGDTLSI